MKTMLRKQARTQRGRATGGRTPRRSRRQTILDEAVSLMRDQGFHGTSIQDVADRLRFTKAAFYYYVKNKEDMLYEISMQTLRLMLDRIGGIANSPERPIEKMRRVIDCYVHLMADETSLFTVYFREKRFLSPRHSRQVIASERQILRMIERIYSEGVASRDFRKLDPAVSVLGILGMCFWMTNWYERQGRLSGAEIAKAFETIVLSGISGR